MGRGRKGINDKLILEMLLDGIIRVDLTRGLVFSPRSNNPDKPLGCLNAKGYLRTCINFCGYQYFSMIHRIIAVAAFGLPPDGKDQINHRDGDKINNHPNNLEWISHIENMTHAKEHGFHKKCGRKDNIRDPDGRFGKKAAGRLLDGRTWDDLPWEKP